VRVTGDVDREAGGVRGDAVSEKELLRQIEELRRRVRELEADVQRLRSCEQGPHYITKWPPEMERK